MTDAVSEGLQRFIHDPAFLERYPYYAAVLSRMVAFHDPGVSSMAVSTHGDRYYLHVNVDYFVTRPEYLCGILLHEVHHVVLGHLDHERFRACVNPSAMELAMELSANEFICERLPEAALTCERFREFGVRPMQSTLERYQILSKRGKGLPRRGPMTVDDHKPRGGWGVRDASRSDGMDSRAALLRVLQALESGQGRGGLLAGRSPGRLIEELMLDAEPPRGSPVDWRRELERFVSQMRSPGHTFRRPNRRFPERIGEIPGRSWSRRNAEQPHLLVAIDTSGSMGSDELVGIARQLGEMRAWSKITIAECDTEITRVYPFRGELTCVVGRGGTNLCPVFAADFLATHLVDGVVYFTDGQGPFPEDDPGVKTLWVLTKAPSSSAAGAIAWPWLPEDHPEKSDS